KKELGKIRHLPEPTHRSSEMRTEYKIRYHKFSETRNFKVPIFPSENLPEWINVRQALSDLPALFLNANVPYSVNKMTTKMPYQSPPVNDYQKKMRYKDANQYIENVDGNSFRKTVRDFRIFERMQPGDDYKKAHEIALMLFKEACEFNNISIN